MLITLHCSDLCLSMFSQESVFRSSKSLCGKGSNDPTTHSVELVAGIMVVRVGSLCLASKKAQTLADEQSGDDKCLATSHSS